MHTRTASDSASVLMSESVKLENGQKVEALKESQDSQPVDLHLVKENADKIQGHLKQLPNQPHKELTLETFTSNSMTSNEEATRMLELVTCVICFQFPSDTLSEVQECEHCNKLFCQTCISKLRDESPLSLKCPQCRQAPTLFRPLNKVLRQMIETMPVSHKCGTNKKCQAKTYSYSSFMAHISQDCPKFGRVHFCPCCEATKSDKGSSGVQSKKYTKSQLENHLQLQCPNIEFMCQKQCNLFVKKRHLKTHNCLDELKSAVCSKDKTIEALRDEVKSLKDKAAENSRRNRERSQNPFYPSLAFRDNLDNLTQIFRDRLSARRAHSPSNVIEIDGGSGRTVRVRRFQRRGNGFNQEPQVVEPSNSFTIPDNGNSADSQNVPMTHSDQTVMVEPSIQISRVRPSDRASPNARVVNRGGQVSFHPTQQEQNEGQSNLEVTNQSVNLSQESSQPRNNRRIAVRVRYSLNNGNRSRQGRHEGQQ